MGQYSNKLQTITLRIIQFVFIASMLLITVLLLCTNLSFSSFHERTFLLPNPVLLILGMIVCLIAVLIGGVLSKNQIFLHGKIRIWILSFVFLIAQLVIVYSSVFETRGWDAKIVFHDAAKLVYSNVPELLEYSSDLNYYSIYPNNRMILLLLVGVLKISKLVGVSSLGGAYAFCTVMQCVLYMLTAAMLFDLINTATHSETAAYAGWLIFVGFLGLSPWVLIIYTDSLGIICPILILWINQRTQEFNVYLRWLVLGFLGTVSYHIKATAIIAFIAVAIVSVLKTLSNQNRDRKIQAIQAAFCVLIFLAVFKGIGTLSDCIYENVTGAAINVEQSVNAIHYMRMGLNEESVGTFNSEDVDESIGMPTVAERNDRNMQVIRERLHEMFPNRLLVQYARKIRMNYDDGSFGYGLTGEEFVGENFSAVWTDSGIAQLIRSFYQPGEDHTYILLHLEQSIWLALMIGALVYAGVKKAEIDDIMLPTQMSMIGILIFTTVFEAQARYTMIYAPLYILISMGTVAEVDKILKARSK